MSDLRGESENIVNDGPTLVAGTDELRGPGVLLTFVAGRYVKPRREERALLFIDLRSSTAIAERLGEARFLDFLNGFFSDVSVAIVEQGGDIHKYVGDQVIATWLLEPGRNAAGIVGACFDARARLDAREDFYRREFGLKPDFRAALHGGAVVVGELGYVKKEIAVIGAAMNTAARILDACRETARPFLASAALLERLTDLPGAIAAQPLPPVALRGKSDPLALFALECEDARTPVFGAAGTPRVGPPIESRSSCWRSSERTLNPLLSSYAARL